MVSAIDTIAGAIGSQTEATGRVSARVEAIAGLASKARRAMDDSSQAARQVKELGQDLERAVGGFRV